MLHAIAEISDLLICYCPISSVGFFDCSCLSGGLLLPFLDQLGERAELLMVAVQNVSDFLNLGISCAHNFAGGVHLGGYGAAKWHSCQIYSTIALSLELLNRIVGVDELDFARVRDLDWGGSSSLVCSFDKRSLLLDDRVHIEATVVQVVGLVLVSLSLDVLVLHCDRSLLD